MNSVSSLGPEGASLFVCCACSDNNAQRRDIYTEVPPNGKQNEREMNEADVENEVRAPRAPRWLDNNR